MQRLFGFQFATDIVTLLSRSNLKGVPIERFNQCSRMLGTTKSRTRVEEKKKK